MLLRFILLAAFVPALLPADGSLEQQVQVKVNGFAGKVSVYAKNLRSGATFSLHGEDPVRTASTIKLPIVVEAFAQALAGKLKMDEHLTLTAAEQVSGSGILSDMTPGDVLPLRDFLLLMITLSDNTATNILLNRVGGDAVNARMASLGLHETRVMRKIMGDGKTAPAGVTQEGAKPENKKWGLGRSSPREMVWLLEKLDRGELVSKEASVEIIAILKKQRDHNGIARDIKDAVVANKAGALDALRSDVGIVYTTDGPIAMAVTVDDMPAADWTPDNPGELMISAISELLIHQLH